MVRSFLFAALDNFNLTRTFAEFFFFIWYTEYTKFTESHLLRLCWPPDGDPTPYTLHSTPYTLHSTLYTLHSTLYTLHPKLYTLNKFTGSKGK